MTTRREGAKPGTVPRSDLGFVEPKPWPFDNCVGREAVLDADHNPPRVVRKVGWRCCMKCQTPYFSQDIMRLRLCDRCKGLTHLKPLGD